VTTDIQLFFKNLNITTLVELTYKNNQIASGIFKPS